MNSHLRTLNILLVAALVLGGMTSCDGSSAGKFEPPYWPTDGWKTALPEEQGIDSTQLVSMFEYIADNDIPLYGLLIVHNGYLVKEPYWHPYGTDDYFQQKNKLEPNFLGWPDMTFFFEQGSDEATLKMTDSPDLKIGLDHRYRLTESLNGKPLVYAGIGSSQIRSIWITSSSGILFETKLGLNLMMR